MIDKTIETTTLEPIEKPRQKAHTTCIRVLLVEDNLMVQKIVAHHLQKLHCNVDLATCGKEALCLAAQHCYDLIVMDIGLPDILGNEVSLAIKQGSLNKDTPIVALSAHIEPHQKEEFLTYGIVEILSKPLMPERGLKMLVQWVPDYTNRVSNTD